MPSPSAPLRELLLAAQVLDEVDLEIHDAGIVLTGGPPVVVRWSSLLAAAQGAPLRTPRARQRVVAWLGLRRQVAELPLGLLADQVRPVGLPVDHVLHPGRDWVRCAPLGGALQLGLGLLGLDRDHPDEVAVIPPSIWRASRIDPAQLWPACATRLEQMGALAARRWNRDGAEVLRPMGGCDVVTLLGAASLRRGLAEAAGGLCPVVVPMRSRGWTQLSRLDPAFAAAAAAATLPSERGFRRPLLVTADEVVLAADGPNTGIGAVDGLPHRDRRAGAFPG
ncbi:MAG TPA: hypothetical protein VGN54_08465 [Mycobacteriales bacterium]|jgi:hypothetical protein|nr:hypothetical protein [Mycobacteriales bacterium]